VRLVLASAVMLANARLAEVVADALPEKITPHSLRRTFATVLCAHLVGRLADGRASSASRSGLLALAP